MTEDEIFNQTKGAYLCLIHPRQQDADCRREMAAVVTLAGSVPDELVASMLISPGWRERLLGLSLAMARKPTAHLDEMLHSLRDPRAIVIVPMCAALAVLAQRGLFPMVEFFPGTFDRTAFDGEVGWAIDKAMGAVGFFPGDVPARGPNYGQIFEDHLEVYSWIHRQEP